MLNADPVFVGAAYTEEDFGSDEHGDTFEITFIGGATGTTLDRVVINGNRDGEVTGLVDDPTLTQGDMYFDVAAGGRGVDKFMPFTIDTVNSIGVTAADVAVTVRDGGTMLDISLQDFAAGDKLVFKIDVDEVEVRSDDPIASGAEFEASKFVTFFSAPFYHDVNGVTEFINHYDPLLAGTGLDLPPDNHNQKADRTDAAVNNFQQQPLPVSISGTVFHDRNRDLRQDVDDSELGIPNVTLTLFQQNETGQYTATGHSTTTNQDGEYLFGEDLGLRPGTYRVVETQPADYAISVGAVPGDVQPGGKPTGVALDTNTLSEIKIPLGAHHAVNQDFAEARPAQVSGHVYHDRNNNGQRNPGEEGIGGVRVELLDDQGQLVGFDITNSDGAYEFTDLDPGLYTIREVHPAAWIDGVDRVGVVSRLGQTLTVGQLAGNDVLSRIELRSEDVGVDYDFGERLGSLTGFVYSDADGDCVFDTGEAPLAGVTMQLLDDQGSVIATAVTNADGAYFFGDLYVGTYTVRQLQPASHFNGNQVVGTGTGDASGHNQISGIRIGEGDIHLSGYNYCEELGSLSGYVYHDRDNDGLREPGSGEEAISGVLIRLLDAQGAVVTGRDGQPLAARTDAAGFYQFKDLAPGVYRIVEVHPSNWIDGRETVGRVNGTTVGSASTNDQFGEIDMSDAESAALNGVNYNFGERLGSISGVVHADRDGDCVLDQDETPIAGVTMELLNAQGTVIATTQTDAAGSYSFGDLQVGTYSVRQVQPTAYFHGDQHVGTGTGDASGRNIITGIQIGGGHVRLTGYNYCEAYGSLSGFVYHDRDNDGLREPAGGEEAISGIKIRLLDEQGHVVTDRSGQPLIAITDDAGFYHFTDLQPGVYRIVEEQPGSWIDGRETVGRVGSQTVGTSTANDQFQAVDISDVSGAALHGVQYNFGERLGRIEGYVHADSDGDCEFDAGETPIAGVLVTLTDQDGNAWTTVTDQQGHYGFDDLPPGTYAVTETQPNEYFSGGENYADSQPHDNVIRGIQIDGNRISVSDLNFCETLGSLSGYVYHDRDDDGRREPAQGEEAIAGVTIRLHHEDGTPVVDGQGNPRIAVTDADGYYEFTDLAPGIYRILEVHPTRWIDGKDTPGTVNGVTVGTANTTADELRAVALTATDPTAAAMHGINYNFGERLGSLEGFVYADTDGDCDFDAGEPAIAGVTVRIVDQNGNTRTATTDVNGRYRFTDLAPGSYTVVEEQPADYFHAGQHVGRDQRGLEGSGDASQANVISGIRVNGGSTHLRDYNFCEHLGSISGYVYHDVDNDGQREANEDGIGNAILTLYDGTGPVATTTSGANGFYRFDGLTPGRYRVVETQPAGWLDGLDTPGKVNGTPSGSRPANDQLAEIDLTANAMTPAKHGVEYNFGELLPGSITGIVFSDTDDDCELDEGELKLSGVRVDLLDADGKFVKSTTTDRDGRYRFDDLRPGEYAVREHQPAGYFGGHQTSGSHGGDASVQNLISTIDVGSNQHLVDYDFCEIPPATISGYVFQDGPTIVTPDGSLPANIFEIRDGLKTSDDKPLAGVTLELRFGFDSSPVPTSLPLPGIYDGEFVRVVTDENGYYEFTGLPSTSYSVYELQPADFVDSLDTPGNINGQTRGFAVNANSQISPLLLANLVANPQNDAILRISLSVGEHSVSNNFSEVLVEPERPVLPPPPPQNPPVVPQTAPNPVNTPNAPPPVVILPQRNPLSIDGGGGYHDFTWHLSVINSGAPRGTTEFVSIDEAAMSFTTYLEQSQWSSTQTSYGHWQLYTYQPYAETHELHAEYRLGIRGGIAVSGDFNGDGISEIAIYYRGEWFIDVNGNGVFDDGDIWAKLGSESDLPVTGDWDGDGKDDIGIFGPAWAGDPRAIEAEPGLPDPFNTSRIRPKNIPPKEYEATDGYRYLKASEAGKTRADLIDHVFHYGHGRDIPVSGDWNGDGINAIGIFRDGKWMLDSNGDGRHSAGDAVVSYGKAGDVPVVGDFDGDGIDNIGIYRAGLWILDFNGNREMDAHDRVFELGAAADQPVVGDWDGDGTDDPGLYRETTEPAQDAPPLQARRPSSARER